MTNLKPDARVSPHSTENGREFSLNHVAIPSLISLILLLGGSVKLVSDYDDPSTSLDDGSLPSSIGWASNSSGSTAYSTPHLTLTYGLDGTLSGASTLELVDHLAEMGSLQISIEAFQSRIFLLTPEVSSSQDSCVTNSNNGLDSDSLLLLLTSPDHLTYGRASIFRADGESGSWDLRLKVVGDSNWRLSITSIDQISDLPGEILFAEDYGINDWAPPSAWEIPQNEPLLNAAGIHQFTYRLIRAQILYEDNTNGAEDLVRVCRIMNEVDSIYRSQIGATIQIEDLIEINPQSEGWSDPESSSGALLGDILSWRNSNHANYGYGQNDPMGHRESIDLVHFFGTTGISELDWKYTYPSDNPNGNNVMGSAYRSKTAATGLGVSWSRDDGSLSEYRLMVNVAHEIGHTIGGHHNDAENFCTGANSVPGGKANLMWFEIESESCYEPDPIISDATRATVQSIGLSDLPFSHTQPAWAEGTVMRRAVTGMTGGVEDGWLLRTWFVQHWGKDVPLVSGENFWRAEYEMMYFGGYGSTFDLFEHFVGIRTFYGLANGNGHWDTWLGYADLRSARTICGVDYLVYFESGWTGHFNNLRVPLQGYDVGDSYEHQPESGPTEWVLWPAFHDRPMTDHTSYGPYSWAAVSWSSTG